MGVGRDNLRFGVWGLRAGGGWLGGGAWADGGECGVRAWVGGGECGLGVEAASSCGTVARRVVVTLASAWCACKRGRPGLPRATCLGGSVQGGGEAVVGAVVDDGHAGEGLQRLEGLLLCRGGGRAGACWRHEPWGPDYTYSASNHPNGSRWVRWGAVCVCVCRGGGGGGGGGRTPAADRARTLAPA